MIHHFSLLRVLAFLAFFMLLPASMVAAQDAESNDSFVLQINRPMTVAPDETHEVLMVIDDNVRVDGVVTNALVVINGDAVVTGEVRGDITVFSGTLTLEQGATVDNVHLFSSQMVRTDGAVITGELNDEASFGMVTGVLSFFSVAFWIGTVIMSILIGVTFVALAGPFMARATETLLQRPLETGVTGLGTWLVLPIVALAAFVSLIGIPVGLAIVLVVIPLLALLGYLVSAFLVGTWLAAVAKVQAGKYLSVTAGVIALQLLGLVPWIGGLVVFVATLFGTGALVWRLWHDRRQHRPTTAPVTPMGGHAHA